MGHSPPQTSQRVHNFFFFNSIVSRFFNVHICCVCIVKVMPKKVILKTEILKLCLKKK